MSDLKYTIDVDTAGAERGLNGLTAGFKALGAVISAGAMAEFGQAVIGAARSMENLNNQLRLVTTSSSDLARTLGVLQQAAVNNRTGFEEFANLFVKVKLSTDQLGISEERLINITSKFSQALAISGADAGTAAGAIRQFGQAMASGVLRGDEFNSIVEALGPALNIMARESGVNVGELRRMAEAGQLTTEVFLKMLENSNALSAAFNQQQPSIQQLEKAHGDAFDRMLVKLGEVTGVTEGYKNLLKDLTRTFDQIAGTQSALVNQSPEQIYAGVERGTVNAQAALDEFSARVKFNQMLLSDYSNIPGLSAIAREINQLMSGQGGAEDLTERNRVLGEYIGRLQERIGIEKDVAEEVRQQQEDLKQQTAEYRELLKPYDEYINRGRDFVKMNIDNRDALTKNRDEMELARATLFNLKQAQEIAATSTFDFTREIEAAEARVMQLEGEYRRLIAAFNTEVYGIRSISDEFDRIIEQQNARYNRETEYLKLSKEEAAVARATEDFREQIKRRTADIEERINRIQATGTEEQKRLIPILQEEQAELVRIGEGQLENVQAAAKYRAQVEATLEAQRKAEQEAEAARRKAEREAERLARQNEERRKAAIRNIQGLEFDGAQRVADIYEQANLDSLSGIERKLKEIELQEKKVADAARQRLIEQFGEEDPDALNARLDDVTRIQEEITRRRQAAASEIYKEQRSFSYGWNKAFREYADEATNSAKQAERLFQQTTQGMEDAIVKFAKTGKFEWKDFVNTILEELLRSGVRELIAQTFGSFGGPAPRMAQPNYGGYGGYGAQAQQYSTYPGMRVAPQQQSTGMFGNLLSSVGNLFSGFFATGGTIPAGRFGVVGEAGPELVSGPATVTPMSGPTQVVYNINAVDAASFQQLLARDPGTLYALTEQGRRQFAGAR